MLRIKRVYSENLRKEVYALRYRAYRKEDSIAQMSDELFEDEYDSYPNHILWALSDDDCIIGSIRTTWFNPAENYIIPEMKGYGDIIDKFIPKEARIVSGNRFVTEPIRRKENFHYMMLLLRIHIMTSSFFNYDWAVAGARQKHLAFYKHTLNLEPISEYRIYPGLTCPMQLIACNFKKNIDDVYQKNPTLKQKGYEYVLLNDDYKELWESGLPIEL